MKGSIVTSAILHVTALVIALTSLGTPASFEVADVEALPVDIVPIEELTQIQQGDKSAPLSEKPAPVPTKKPTPVENAENVGDNDVDLKTPPTPINKPVVTETAAAPEKVEKVQPTIDDETNDVKEVAKEETVTAPATEVAAKAEPPREVTPETKPEPTPQEQPPEEAQAEEIPLPENVPVPASKPKPEPTKVAEAKPAESKPAEAQTAKTPDRKQSDKAQETAKSKSSKESDFNADEVAALLNKTEPVGGGAKRSPDKASAGGKKTTGTKLSQSEMDALRGQIQNNWSIMSGIADADGIQITVKFSLDQDGMLVGDPEVSASGGSPSAQRVLMGGAKRAVLKSAPFKNLPRDKYDAWSEVIVHFDPSELL